MPRSIEIRPNRSLSARGAWWFFAGLATLCLAVALVFASLGLWVVLPFAGAELALLGIALALSLRASSRRELIHIERERLVVEHRPRQPGGRQEFRRPWVRIDLQRSPVRHHPTRLLLRQRSRVCEVGRCLTDQERLLLWARLREILRSP